MAAFVGHALYFDDGPYSVYDDSFISFRYSQNLARGHGLVYNPGERVEGYTNFLWTLLMAGAIALGIDVIIASKVVAMAAGLAALWVVFHLLRQELGRPWLGVLAAGMLALTTSFARFAVSGFEMQLYGWLIILGIYLYLRAYRAEKAPYAAGVVLALAAMTRPEGVMVYGIVTLHYLVRLHRTPAAGDRWRYLGTWLISFGLVYGPYFLWRYTYYGYPLPNTFYAKVGSPGLVQLTRGLIYLRDILLSNVQVVICLLVGVFWPGRWVDHKLLLVGLVGIYLGYFVAVGGDNLLFFGPRFLVPLLPLIYVLGAGGLAGLAARLRPQRQKLMWTGLLGIIIPVMIFLSSNERLSYTAVTETGPRGWQALAHWLAPQVRPGETLAVDAAGIIPFYTGLYTIDMLGLNDLHIAHLDVPIGRGAAGHEKYDPEYVLLCRPAYIATWVNPQGQAGSWGMAAVADELQADYTLWAVVLMRPPADNEPRIIASPNFTSELYEKGYRYGVFRRNS